jgi:hypothetical protein
MDIPNAFIGKKKPPTNAEVSAALGTTWPLWQQLANEMADQHAVTTPEWYCASQKYGWSLRLKRNKRTIIHLAPCKGCFRALFILDNQAVAAALQSDLPKDLLKKIKDAPTYSEGTGVKLTVTTIKDLPTLHKLATLKLRK